MEHNFKTKGGLKVRLDHRYFYDQLKNEKRQYSEDEIINDDFMFETVEWIEALYFLPVTWIQVITLVSIIIHPTTPIFFVLVSVAFIIGECLRYLCFISYISFFYTRYRIFFCLALVALVFIFKSQHLIVPYLIVRLVKTVIDFLWSTIVARHTNKKYGTAYTDVEMVAFKVFKKVLKRKESLGEYITNYSLAMRQDDLIRNGKM